MRYRTASGATLALVAACALVIVIIGVAFFFLMRIIGGGRELQHAVDAGNLNIAKQLLAAPGVNSSGMGSLSETNPDEAQFIGVGDSSRANTINLNCINRVFAQTMLVAANARAMHEEGSNTGLTDTHARAVEDAAELIGQRLAQSLADKNAVTAAFGGVTASNSIRMLKGGAQNPSDLDHAEHAVSFTDRGAASNVKILDTQIPGNIRTNIWNPIKSARTINIAGEGDYLRGYVDGINLLDRNVYFVPLKDSSDPGSASRFRNSQPHLIQRSTFQDQQATTAGPAFGWTNPVPNSFLDRADTQEIRSATTAKLASCALSQSLQPPGGFTAAIPRGFIRIRNQPCPNSGNFSSGSNGQDIFVWLMNNPQVYGIGTGAKHFESSPGDNLNDIVQANQNGQTPDPAKCNALTPPAGAAECAQITGISPVQDNNTASPSVRNEIRMAYGLGPDPAGGPQAQFCASALELANLDLLTQRVAGDESAEVRPFSSGVRHTPDNRGGLGNGSYQIGTNVTLADLYPTPQRLTDSPIMVRVAQRLAEMLPSYNGVVENLPTVIDGWSTTAIPMGENAYIFFQGTTDQTTGVQTGRLVVRGHNSPDVPTWLRTIGPQSASPNDGNPAAYEVFKRIFDAGPSGPLLNVNSDWGFPTPYDFFNGARPCLKDTLVFSPGTGHRGMLGEIFMGECFGNSPQSSCNGGPVLRSGPDFEIRVDRGNRNGGAFSAPQFNNCTGDTTTYTGPC
jgi:hypothetical protein